MDEVLLVFVFEFSAVFRSHVSFAPLGSPVPLVFPIDVPASVFAFSLSLAFSLTFSLEVDAEEEEEEEVVDGDEEDDVEALSPLPLLGTFAVRSG